MERTNLESKVAKRKRQRDETISEMTPALREALDTIKAKLESQRRTEIIVGYEVGSKVREIHTQEKKYGESAVKDVALALGGERAFEDLWAFRNFVNAYPEDKVRKLATKRTAGGNRLSLDHLQQLIGMSSAEREKWLKYVIEEDLTARELATAIYDKHKPRRRTPKIRPPKRVLSGLSQIRSYADAIGRRISIWDRHVFRKILKCSADDCTDDLLDQLDQTLEAERQTIAHAEHVIQRAEEAKKRVQRAIKLRNTRQNDTNAEDTARPDTPMVKKSGTRSAPLKKLKKKASTEGTPIKKSKSVGSSTGKIRRKVKVKRKKVKRKSNDDSGRPGVA